MSKIERQIRRGSLITPWGIGSIIPFPNDDALMIAGLDNWFCEADKPEDYEIEDHRLAEWLGVKGFRWPPDYHEKGTNKKIRIPSVRFPGWYYCPKCGNMTHVSYYSTVKPTCHECAEKNPRKPVFMLPDRYIVICPNGHIDDFPLGEWLHHGSDHEYNHNTCQLRRISRKGTTSYSVVQYECTTCGVKKSFGLALLPDALSKIDWHCKGAMPWLGIDHSDCDCHPSEIKVSLVNASNVWFGETRSSIYIPYDDMKAKIRHDIDSNFQMIKSLIAVMPIKQAVSILVSGKKLSEDMYCKMLEKRIKSNGWETDNEDIDEDNYRKDEYDVLRTSIEKKDFPFRTINLSIDNYDSKIHKYFKSISLVPKLKETRALTGFSRLVPAGEETDLKELRKNMSRNPVDWLPAIEVYGEGIFFEFNYETMQKWLKNEKVKKRISLLDTALTKSKFYHHYSGASLKPEFVMIHTFAHLLINQLSFECGYGSSSLRERIYCEKYDNHNEMHGVLIYTASGDSEGSLGGLVQQGKPKILENTILAAIENARWCSSDPVCIESTGQGTGSCNLAACYNCALLPETSCECGNRLLDRGVLIGTIDNPEIGFFSELK